jgi:N-acyl-D-aspartate/D-glutamate deacylase
MAHRGRLQEGMIADITVFDYKTVLDQSTPEKPATESIGIKHVIVNGEVGLRDGVLDRSVKAGVGIKSDFVKD